MLLSLLFCIITIYSRAGCHNLNTDTAINRIDSFLQAAIANQWMVGSTALVYSNGKIVYDKAFGFRDREAGISMETSDIFRIASMTKPIVSVAVMILVEQGKIKLDDAIEKYTPGFKDPRVLVQTTSKDSAEYTVPAKTPVTIHHLLTHTSGISSPLEDKRLAAIYSRNKISPLAAADSAVLADKMQVLSTLPLGVQPGEKFYYGLSTDVLGYIIEIVSGKKLDAFLNENILHPLQMHDTYFYLPENKSNRLAAIYAEFESGKLMRIPPVFQNFNINYPISGPRTYFSGSGGLCSTTHDYLQFLQMLLNGGSLGKVKILRPETVAMMEQNQIGALSLANSNKFGFGFEIENRINPPNGAKKGKLTWGGAFNTLFWIDPERKAFAVLMTQVYPAKHQRDFFRGFETIVNQTLDSIH
jgi:CubicO group peptidase (beta-lactamase class C family)